MLLITFLIVLLIYIYITLRKTTSYWKEKGVKFIKPLPLVGNMLPALIQTVPTAQFIQDLYNAYPKERYCGIYQFTTPVLLVRDLELIKKITIKNFENFTNHAAYITADADPLWGKSLFSVQGTRWRDLRQTMSPVFTSAKMKIMFVLMDERARNFVEFFKNKNEEIIEVEMKDIFGRYANDVIATTAFGIQCDSLNNQNNDFLKAGRELTNLKGWNRFKFILYGNYPKLTKFFKLKIVNNKIGKFFTEIIKETIVTREDKKIWRPDLIQLLMEARKGNLRNDKSEETLETGFATALESDLGQPSNTEKEFLTDEDITAQALVFFFGGFDTASSLMCFAAYELAVNPDIQSKLRDEFLEIPHNQISYESLLGMKYLDMVICETLRKWTQAIWIDRKCTKEFTIEPERVGEKPLTLNVGDICWLPIYAICRDPRYYSNPEVFDPERFNSENKLKLDPLTYMPFGAGPRNCIGSRFALLETKILLFYLLRRFKIVPIAKTRIPLELCRDTFLITAKDGFHLGLKLIKSP